MGQAEGDGVKQGMTWLLLLSHRQFETVIPMEDSVVTEMTVTLRDWGVMWKQLYVVSGAELQAAELRRLRQRSPPRPRKLFVMPTPSWARQLHVVCSA